MAGNRKLPFGYKMAAGAVVVDAREVVVVQYIFQKYILGDSYRELVVYLRKQDVPYASGKVWNKNMVARVLENEKYLGQSGWPPVIHPEQFELAAIRRADKAGPHQRTEVQKALQQLGYSNSTAFTEHQVLSILNRLIADPDQICLPETRPQEQSKLVELQLALKQELERQPVNEDAAKELAMARASAQYNAIGNQGYETERLRRLFRELEPLSELNASLLRSAISEVQIRRHKLNIRLKNGQIIEGGTAI